MAKGNIFDMTGGFDANEVSPNDDYTALPAGDYEVVIVNSESRDTKAGDGVYLLLEMQVIVGDYKGRKLFDRLNLINPSEKAVQIARGTLSSICRAVDVMSPNDSSELHDKPFIAVVRTRIREDTGEKANEINRYKPTMMKRTPAQVAAATATTDEIPF